MSTSLTHLHNAHVAAFFRDDADWFDRSGAPAAAKHFREKAAAELEPVEVEIGVLVGSEVGQVVGGSAVSGGLSSEGVDKSGFFNSVADGSLQQVVNDPNPYGGRNNACDEGNDDFGPVSLGQADFHLLHSFGVSDAKHFCPPPAVNAEVQPGGSAEAGQGVGTSPETLLEWAFDSYFSFLDNRDAGLRGLADRDKARCLRHLWAWMTEIQRHAGRS